MRDLYAEAKEAVAGRKRRKVRANNSLEPTVLRSLRSLRTAAQLGAVGRLP